MRLQTALSLLLGLGSVTALQRPDLQCRCTPDDACWPQPCHWRDLNKNLGGSKLIRTAPIAESCYDGPSKDLDKCAYVTRMWPDQDFLSSNPIGRVYPYNLTCPTVNYAASETPTSCLLGISPAYAVNATTKRDIALTLQFAKDNNVRLVIASTGHDLLGRSDGYGGIELWLRYYRNGINFQSTFNSAKGCKKSGWTGSAIHIDGAWQWKDVFKVAQANNVIAIGGGSKGPGAIGGWPSGGGHGPGTRNYGMGADQVLEAEVMLADGRIVTANHCENTDLFRAIRGGGPGYGIVLSQHVKTYPNVDVVTAHHLSFAPLQHTPENVDFLNAIAAWIQQVPGLVERGYAGYGFWFRNYPRAYVNGVNSGYTHGFWNIGKGQAEAETAIAPALQALNQFKDKLFIQSTFKVYPDYWSFYYGESGLYDPAGTTSFVSSRLINPEAVADYQAVRDAVEILGGKPTQVASNVLLLVSGGAVSTPDPSSGLNPAWRRSPFVMVAGAGLPKVATPALRDSITHDVTYVRGAALKALAPDTGGYMNEGDGNDPDYIQTFYGANYASHLAAKNKYDPKNVFYCRTCVGAEGWVERPDGPLCRKA